MTLDTCSKSEYLEMQSEIETLSRETLSDEEFNSAEEISKDIVSSKTKKERARERIRAMMGVKPPRPLFYANAQLKHLPRYTRDAIRYVGDYVDHLVKFWSAEMNGQTFSKKSLGVNLTKMKGQIDEGLRAKLVSYNNNCYVPAKHDFNVKDRKRRFTARETVHICFVTMVLARNILNISKSAKAYAEQRINDCWAEMKYGPENKDSFCS